MKHTVRVSGGHVSAGTQGPGSFYGVQEKWGGKEGGRKAKGIVWVALNFDWQTWIMIP